MSDIVRPAPPAWPSGRRPSPARCRVPPDGAGNGRGLTVLPGPK